MILGDIEKALELYEKLGGAILYPSNEEHFHAVQQVIAAFPEAARRALAAEARVRELETRLKGPLKVQLVIAKDCFCGDEGDYMARVCATPEVAQEYIKRFGYCFGIRELKAEEWEVDGECPPVQVAYIVSIDPHTGMAASECMEDRDRDEHTAWGYYWHSGALHRVIGCSTRGRDEAFKLAQEKLAELKAEKEAADP